ncbi:MAG TPA: radical SAM protein [Clostridia bacterium]|nr:radical SAM protein [Clostridia bacterium]
MLKLLVAGETGEYFELPDVGAVGRSGSHYTELIRNDMIKIPDGSTLVYVPEGVPLGVNEKGDFASVPRDPQSNERLYAISAILPQGYTRTYLPAYLRPDTCNPLPLKGYTAVALVDGEVYVAAEKTEEPGHWDPIYYNTDDLERLVKKTIADFPRNRIIAHLAHCALEYNCYTAQNIFYRRWEGGIPVSNVCNAHCLGCISLQEAPCCPAQERIKFRPGVDEVVELAVHHLTGGEGAVTGTGKGAPEGAGKGVDPGITKGAVTGTGGGSDIGTTKSAPKGTTKNTIVSFGQGCEGEPSLAADIIAPAVKKVRLQTSAGTLNMNTNGGDTAKVLKICSAGLNSIRVSLISARAATYEAYTRPKGYGLQNVMDTVKGAREQGVFVAVNLLAMPGLTDTVEEAEALLEFLSETGVQQLQMRNLNIDPDLLLRVLGKNCPNSEPLGISRLIKILREEVPGLVVGSYSKPV